MAYQVRPYASYTSQFENPYKWKGSPNSDLSELMSKAMANRFTGLEENDPRYVPRSGLDRTLDFLMTPLYASAGLVDGFVQNFKNPGEADWLLPYKQAGKGVLAGINVFGDGDQSSEYTYSKVLETAGWNPTSTAGKITKGAIGFGLDVLLDPTTYLSGGTSALVKGTGRTAATTAKTKQVAERIPQIAFNNRVDDLVTQGVSKPEAQRQAYQYIRQNSDRFDAMKSAGHMTNDMAEEIIKRRSYDSGYTVTGGQLKRESENLASEYNRLMGIRNVDGAGAPVTFGVGNLPFVGQKIAPKLGVFGKTATISSGDNLRKVSDALKISHGYSALRANIYGRKIGEMFSTTSPLWRLGQENPAKLYDFMKFMDITKGKHMDKLAREKEIRQRAAAMNFTPAEQEKVIKMLEDKRIVAKVAETLKISQTKQGQEVSSALRHSMATAEEEIDHILQARATIDNMKFGLDGSIDTEKYILDSLQREYREKLASINVDAMRNTEGRDSVITLLKQEAKKMDEELEVLKAQKPNVTANSEHLDELVKRAKGETDEVKKYHDLKKSLRETKKGELNPDNLVRPELNKVLNDAVDDELFKMNVEAPNNASMDELRKTLSTYVFGENNKFHTLKGKALDDVVGLVKRGSDPDVIKAHMEKNPQFYSEHWGEVNKYIAGKIGYEKWEEAYRKPMAVLQEKMASGQQLASFEIQEYMHLRQLDLFRRSEFERLFNGMSYDDFKAIRREEANAALTKALEREIDIDNERRRAKFLDNDSATVDEFRGVDMRHSDIMNDMRDTPAFDIAKMNEIMSSGEKQAMVDNVLLFLAKRPGNSVQTSTITPAALNAAEEIAEEMRALMVQRFPDRAFTNLTSGQRAYLMNTAIKTRFKGGKTDLTDDAKKALLQEAERRAGTDRLQYITDSVKEGTTVHFHDGTRIRAGEVKRVEFDPETGTKYTVEVRGETHEIFARDVKKFQELNKEKMSGADLVDASKVAQDHLAQMESVSKRIDELNAKIRSQQSMKGATAERFNKERNALEAQFTKIISEQQEKLVGLENSRKAFDDTLESLVGASNSVLKKQDGGYTKEQLNDDLASLLEGKNAFSDDFSKLLESENYTKEQLNDDLASLLEGKNAFDTNDALDVHISSLQKQIEEYEEALSSDEALALWMKNHNPSDVALLSDPHRYTRNVEYIDEFTEPGKEGWLASANGVEGVIKVLEREIKPSKLYGTLRSFAEELVSKGWDGERIHAAFQKDPVRAKRFLLEHEKSHLANKDYLKTDRRVGDYTDPKTREIELRANLDALKMIENYNPDEIVKAANEALATTFQKMEEPDRIKKWVLLLQEEFEAMGRAEVSIGSLKPQQFEEMLGRYVPHILTPYGKKYFDSIKEFAEHKPGITQDYGYGRVFNPFSQSRTIQDKNLFEINDYFKEKLQGNNLFSTNISEIYLARALKHEELMYDNFYMNTMLDIFGKEIKGGVVEEGYKAVANYGQVRELVYNMAKTMAGNNKQSRIPFEKHLDTAISQLGLTKGILDDFATPMIELTQKQVKTLDAFGLAKQVSEPIVQKANQTRKLAIQRDQNRFLKLHDKFLHWMKLMQTTVMPSFHVRNKASNMYLEWLGSGVDALNPKLQIAATKAAWAKGDPEKLKGLDPVRVNRADGGMDIYHWNEIYELAKMHKVIDEGFFAQDVGAGAASNGLFKKLPAKYDITDTENFIGFRAGMALGSRIENSDRMIQFVSRLKRGDTIEQAVASTKKYMFDYSDLTAFEMSTMKRLMPYYTWLRKNGRLQVSELLEQPGKYRDTGKVMEGISSMNSEEDRYREGSLAPFAQDWIQSPFSVRGEKDGDPRKSLMFNPNLPILDLSRIPDPLDPMNSLRELAAQGNPMLKTAAEVAMNKSFFFDEPLADENDSRLAESLKHIAMQTAPGVAMEGAVTKSGADAGLHLLNNLTGLKGVAYDEEVMTNMVKKKYYENISDTDFAEALASTVKDMYMGAAGYVIGKASDMRYKAIDGVMHLTGQPPKTAGEYTGALRPLSATSYNKLSESEKMKYEAPTNEEAAAYHKRAVTLAERENERAGTARRFTWALLDKIDGDDTKAAIGHITKVTDGDTFTVKIGDGKEREVRVLLVDTPESAGEYAENPMPLGKEASDYSKHMLFGKDVRLRLDGEDKYGRLLAFVELDGEDYNKKLIEEGFGKVSYLFGRDEPIVDEYFDTEIEAAKEKRGIWNVKNEFGEAYSEPGYDTGFYFDAIERALGK